MIQGNDFSIIASTSHGPKPPADIYTVRFKTELETLSALRLEAVTFDELPRGGPGRDPERRLRRLRDRGEGRGRPAARAAQRQRLDARRPGASPPPTRSTGGRDAGGWALAAADGESHRLVVELGTPLAREGETTTLTLVVHQNAGSLRTLGRLRLSGTSEPLPVRTAPGLEPPPEIVTTAGLEPAARTKEQQTALAKFYRREAPELQPARAALRAAELERQAFLESVPAGVRHDGARARPGARAAARQLARRLGRGRCRPASPQFLPPLATAARRATRLDLARWLMAPENPLTARVLVEPAVEAVLRPGPVAQRRGPGRAGRVADAPGAARLAGRRARGRADWDVKRLLRTLVTSATYRQSSALTPALAEKDPANRLYARQARFRLDAELVRDNALAVSGLLSPRLGGPSVFPYQPAGYWAYLNFPPREWDAVPGRRPVPARRSTPGGSAASRSPAWSPSTRRAARSARASACARTCRSRRSRCSTTRPTSRPRASSPSAS